MTGSYLSQNYTLDILWLCIGVIPTIAVFAMLIGAKVEDVKRSFRRPAPVQARIHRPQSH